MERRIIEIRISRKERESAESSTMDLMSIFLCFQIRTEAVNKWQPTGFYAISTMIFFHAADKIKGEISTWKGWNGV